MSIELLSPAYCDAMNVYQTRAGLRCYWTEQCVQDWLLMLDAGGEL